MDYYQVLNSIDPKYLKTKIQDQDSKTFNLVDVKDRLNYYKYKFGEEIDKIKRFLEDHTLIMYFMGPKFVGKGTYISMLRELFGYDTFNYISVGDIYRKFLKTYKENKKEYNDYLAKNYRGFLPLQTAIDRMLSTDLTVTKPDELMLALIKMEIDKMPRKTILIDGFLRTENQIAYTLYFRDIINYREDPDVIILVNAPLSVLEARVKYRVMCPKCRASYNTKLLPTSKIGYDKNSKEFYLCCDNPSCNGQRLQKKPGDELGLEQYMPRIKNDLKLMDMARQLQGVPKIELLNSIEVDFANQFLDPYEFTPEYEYKLDKDGKVQILTKSWIVEEKGHKYYSLLPAGVIGQFIRQFIDIFNL